MVQKKRELVTRPGMTLSGQAQQLYDNLIDLKEDIAKARKKRQDALMENSRYSALKELAMKITKEATQITRVFDNQHPEYKKKADELADEAKLVAKNLSRIAVEAMYKGINLEVFHGRGKSKKAVKFSVNATPSLF